MPFFDNLPARNRLSALFDINQPQQVQNQMDLMGVNPTTPVQTPSQEMDIRSLYQPEHQGIDMMNKMISEMPQRNKPGIWRQIFGGLAQAVGGGPGARDNILYGPYYRDLADWNARFKPIEDLANQERGANTANRQFAQTVLNNRAAQDKLDLATRAQDEKERKARVDEEIKRFRAAAYDFKTRNPNMSMQVDKNGLLVGVNPQTGEAHYIRDTEGNKIESGKLSEQDKLELQLANRLTAIEAEEGSTRRMEEIRQRNREELANLQHTNRTSEIQTRVATGGSGSDSNSALNEMRTRFNNAVAALVEHPEWKGWIEIADPTNNTFTVRTPDEMRTGGFLGFGQNPPDWNTYAQIVERILGKSQADLIRSAHNIPITGTNTSTQPPTRTTPNQVQRVRMKKPDGSIVGVAIGDVERAKKAGYVEVK